MNPRPPSTSVPFAWQDKRMLRRIREQCEEAASALSVYFALSVVASDTAREEFQTTHGWLASLSGFSERTIRNRLTDLERLEAVHIHTPAIKGPCTYRLLPFGNGCRSTGNGCRTFGNREAPPLPPSEERKKGIQTVNTTQAKPRTVPERIAAENRLKILRSRFQILARDTCEQWQCDANPELVTERIRLRNEITALENTLL